LVGLGASVGRGDHPGQPHDHPDVPGGQVHVAVLQPVLGLPLRLLLPLSGGGQQFYCLSGKCEIYFKSILTFTVCSFNHFLVQYILILFSSN